MIAATVIELAQKLSLQVVAEGIENIEQMQFFKDYGCDLQQGSHFLDPVTAPVVLEKLKADWQ